MNPEKESHIIRNTLLVSGLLTVALHGYIESQTEDAHGPRVNIGELNPFADVESTTEFLHYRSAGSPYIDTRTITETEVISGGEIGSVNPGNIQANYARKFDQDSAAGIFDEETASQTLNTVEQLQKEGWKVRVTVTGLASAEDDSLDETNGLQSQSDVNQRLANFRRDALVKHMTNAGMDSSIIELKEGQEDSFSDDQMHVMEGLQVQFGYDTIAKMVDAYNLNPDQVPPAIKDTLDDWLGTKRGTRVMVIAERVEDPTYMPTTTEKEVCVIPVIKVNKETQTTEETKVTIPYGIGIPVGLLGLGTFGITMYAGGAGLIAASRSRKTKADNRSVEKPDDTLGGAGGGSGNLPLPESDQPEPGEPGETPEPNPVENTETIVHPPLNNGDKKKRRFRPIWLLPPIILFGSALAINSCIGDEPAPKPKPAPTKDDICRDLETEQKIVDTQTIVVKDGHKTYIKR